MTAPHPSNRAISAPSAGGTTLGAAQHDARDAQVSDVGSCPDCPTSPLLATEQDGNVLFRCQRCATLWHYGLGRLWTVSR